MEQFLTTMTHGLGYVAQPTSILLVVIGTAWGMIGAALPGISVSVTLTILIPFTIWMGPERAVILLGSALVGTGWANNIPAILIRTPGTPSAVLVVVEGFPLHRQGMASKALGTTLLSSAVGQVFANITLVALVLPLSKVAIYFLPPEVFALCLLGLTAAAGLTGKNVVKGIVAAGFGIALATIGPDPIAGPRRFTFGIMDLQDGLGLVSVVIGMLAVSEVFRAARQMVRWEKAVGKFRAEMPTLAEIRLITPHLIIGTIIGIFVGVLPGAGGSAAAFIAYQQSKLWAKYPEKFGKGSLEGLVAADTANNAVYGGELVPTIALGVPGSLSAAIIMGALIMQGIVPGPLLMSRNPEVLEIFFGAMMAATVAGFVLGFLAIGPAIWVTSLSRPAVVMGTLALCTVGVFAIQWSMFDVLVAFIFGGVGYFMYQYGYSPAAAVLGFILGGLVEENFRLGMLMSGGDLRAFVTRPITAALLLVSALNLAYPYLAQWWQGRKRVPAATELPDQEVGARETN